MVAPCNTEATTSAPGSRLRTASTAEASRTTLFTRGFFAALAEQFVNQAHTLRDKAREVRLRFAQSLLRRRQPEPCRVFDDQQSVACREFHLLPHLGGKHDPPRGIHLRPKCPVSDFRVGFHAPPFQSVPLSLNRATIRRQC